MYLGCGFDVVCRPRALKLVSVSALLQFVSLDLLTPSQAADLTLSSGALNSTSQINLVFYRLEKGDAFKNVDEFFTALIDQEVTAMLTLSETSGTTILALWWHL